MVTSFLMKLLTTQHYFVGTNAIIFVVDSNDSKRFEVARLEISRLLADEYLRGSPHLVYANKQVRSFNRSSVRSFVSPGALRWI